MKAIGLTITILDRAEDRSCVAIHSSVKDNVGCTTEPVFPNLTQSPCHHQHHQYKLILLRVAPFTGYFFLPLMSF